METTIEKKERLPNRSELLARKKTHAERLEQIEAQLTRLDEMEVQNAIKKSRAADTRLKILAGAFLLDSMKRCESTRTHFARLILDFHGRQTDLDFLRAHPLFCDGEKNEG